MRAGGWMGLYRNGHLVFESTELTAEETLISAGVPYVLRPADPAWFEARGAGLPAMLSEVRFMKLDP